jgi:hypothetical protein
VGPGYFGIDPNVEVDLAVAVSKSGLFELEQVADLFHCHRSVDYESVSAFHAGTSGPDHGNRGLE